MEWASQIGLLVFLIASGATGARLLWRGRLPGAVHERLLGIAYFAGGPLGYTPLILVISGAAPEEWTRALRCVGHADLTLSALALFAFNRIVFRPGARWTTVAAAAALAAGQLGLWLSGDLERRALGGSPAYWLDLVVRACAYVWAAAESLAHYARARRRLALGLVEPAVVRRFLLWGVAMAAISAIFANAVAAALLAGDAPPAAWYLIDGALAVIASAAMWITFFPSRRRAPAPARA
jgi:hypothetical protein